MIEGLVYPGDRFFLQSGIVEVERIKPVNGFSDIVFYRRKDGTSSSLLMHLFCQYGARLDMKEVSH